MNMQEEPVTDNDPAVEAAAVAIVRIVHRDLHPDGAPCRLCDIVAPEMARAALAAARPIIEAEVRERIAGDIEARRGGVTDQTDAGRNVLRGLSTAARIARGEQ